MSKINADIVIAWMLMLNVFMWVSGYLYSYFHFSFLVMAVIGLFLQRIHRFQMNRRNYANIG
jgi:hypothetical protein